MNLKTKFKQTEIGKIPEEWEVKSFNELIINIVDNRGKTAPVSENGIPLIATNCIKEIGLYPIKENLRFVSKETYDNWFRGHPKPNDIIIVNKGTPGMVCLVPDPVDFCFAQDMVSVRPDVNKIYGKFLFAFMRSRRFKHEVDSLNVGTTIPHLKKTYFPMLKIPIPPPNEQKIIGDVYYNLCYKIELNHQMNLNLESIGQTLFKHWFIDFEFPNDKGKPYKSSGGEMIYSEELKKEIPKTWTEGFIEDIAEVVGGGTPSTKKSDYFSENGIPWLTPKDLSGHTGKYISRGERDISKKGLENSSAKLMPTGTVLFTSRAPIGYIAIALNEISTNQGFKSLIPKENMKTEYLYQTIKKLTPLIKSRSSGSTFSEISGGEMKKVSLVIPPLNIVSKFEVVVEHFNKMIKNNQNHITTLTRLRDVLLPKLMSGQIRVPVEVD